MGPTLLRYLDTVEAQNTGGAMPRVFKTCRFGARKGVILGEFGVEVVAQGARDLRFCELSKLLKVVCVPGICILLPWWKGFSF